MRKDIASGFSKGPIILEILKRAEEFKIPLPPKIALIDDLDENIGGTKEALEGTFEYYIPFLGIHYTAAKNLVEEEVIAEFLFLETQRVKLMMNWLKA